VKILLDENLPAPGQPVAVSELGFDTEKEALARVKELGLPLREVQPICKTEDDIIRTCGDADVLLVQWAPVTRASDASCVTASA